MDLSAYVILDIVIFILILSSLSIAYKILIRTRKEFHTGIFYIFISIAIYGLSHFLKMLNSAGIILSFWPMKIVEMWFLIMLIVGFWHILKCIKSIDNESKKHL
jgi:hypothetical protein